MKKISVVLVSLLLALLIAAAVPVHAFASSTGSSGKYISEVRVGYAKEAEDARSSLDGYTILKDKDGNEVDLNSKAGGGTGSKGDRVVYLGYKTTDDINDAVTDLAVMNMKGGYNVKDYELLMESQMKSQIIPFVDNFKTAIEEYRVNYNSDNARNKARAKYVHDSLNTLTDDDTGKGLGDLLLAKTKYEMGDEYDALSDTEKKEHADILTIIAQANGQATLLFENLITRGADTGEDSWFDRLSDLTYDDMLADSGLSPSKARQALDKSYYDDALKMAQPWETFREKMLDYDKLKATVDNFDTAAYEKAVSDFENAGDNISDEEYTKLFEAYSEAQDLYSEYQEASEYVGIYEYIKDVEYDGGTMLDLFTTDASDLNTLYPFIASLSDGQRAGLDFVNIKELFSVALTNEDGYSDAPVNEIDKVSIYDHVDRDIYKPGGVALTSDAIRNNALEVQEEEYKKGLSGLTISMMVITGVTAVAFMASLMVYSHYNGAVVKMNTLIEKYYSKVKWDDFSSNAAKKFAVSKRDMFASRSSMCGKLSIGIGVAMIILAGYTTYLTWKDLTEKYKVDFSPIPKYIVDEKDITAYNAKGEKIVINNQSAYYKVAETNRNEGDDWYDVLGTSNDLGGGVGKQWVALYSVKNDKEDPILASSLLAVVNDSKLPAGYENGIHMFGTDAAFNMNNHLYVWNDDAPETYVYFQRDEGAKADITGSVFSGGLYALVAAGGILLGVLGAMLVTKIKKKKKA